MIKLNSTYTENKKELVELINQTQEVTVEENSFIFKTDAVLADNVPRLYNDLFYKNIIDLPLKKFCQLNRHNNVEILKSYKVKLQKDNFIEWHVSSDQGQYECFFGVDTKGININYYDAEEVRNKTIELKEGELLFVPTHIPRGIDKIEEDTTLIIFYLNIHNYKHEK